MSTQTVSRHFCLLLLLFPILVRSQTDGLNEQQISLLAFDKNVTTEGDETSPLRYADKLFYATETRHESTGREVIRTFSTLRDEPAHLLAENPRSPARHMADLSFSLKVDRMYYSLFRKDRNGNREECEIWYRERNYDGTWGPQIRPPKPLNVYGCKVMHPAFGHDHFTGKEVLFFVSDRAGGKGGLDIWMSEIVKGMGDAEDTFKEPVNLPFNTKMDEVTPFFDTKTQTLYFSSEGHDGPGGKDIVRVKRGMTGEWDSVEALPAPLNSEYNDQYFSMHLPSGSAYLSSNRPDEKCTEPTCLNFDIYQFELKTELKLQALDASTRVLLDGCNIELTVPSTGVVLTTLLNVPYGRATLEIAPQKPYQVIVSKPGYYPFFLDVQAAPDDVFSLVEKTVHLKPMRPVAVQEEAKGN